MLYYLPLKVFTQRNFTADFLQEKSNSDGKNGDGRTDILVIAIPPLHTSWGVKMNFPFLQRFQLSYRWGNFLKLLHFWSRNVVNRGICSWNICPSVRSSHSWLVPRPKWFKISKYALDHTPNNFLEAKCWNPEFSASPQKSALRRGSSVNSKNRTSNPLYFGKGAW